MTFVLSDSSKRNSKGFRVALSGGRLDRFRDNPVMLYDHDHKQVIGRWENIRIDDGKLKADPVFDVDDPAAAEIARKVEKGFLRGASIGIIPFKMEEVDGEFVLTDWEQLEASVTAIPSDAGAVRLYNEEREEITIEQFKLSFSNTQNNNPMENTILLTAATCASLGLSSTPTAKQVELAVAEKDVKITNLESQIKTLLSERITTYLSQAAKDGKIDVKEIPSYTALAEKGFDQVKEIIDGKPIQATASLKDMEQRTGLAAGERSAWDYVKWMKEDPKGLQQLRADNPTEFERLQTEFQTKN